MIINVPDLDATNRLGRTLAEHLFAGAVIALVGPLGAGKTHFVKAIAEGLGIASHQVNSPTFVLIQEYEGRFPVYHFDAYRLSSEGEFADLGAHEYFQGRGVCLVEWADRVPNCMPSDYLEVKITPTGTTSRRFELISRGPRHDPLIVGANLISGSASCSPPAS